MFGSFSTYCDGTNDGGDLVDDLLEFLQRDGACIFQFFNEEFHVVLLLQVGGAGIGFGFDEFFF